MSYEQNVTKLAGRSAQALSGLYQQYLDGVFSRDEFDLMASTLISQVNAKAAIISELTLGGYGGELVSTPMQDASKRIGKALATIMASELDTAMQLERLAANETLTAASDAFGKAMRGSSNVKGYTRGLNRKACELCVWLYKDGYVYPAEQPMHTHTGCLCHPVPTFTHSK